MLPPGDPRDRIVLLPNERIDRFHLSTRLGEGATAVVFAAIDERDGRTVALKILHPSADASERARFLREARIAATVKHPDVVEMHEVIEKPGFALMMMELVYGTTLRSRLSHFAATNGRMPRAEALQIAERVCRALAAVHGAGIVHCDVKPENVLLGDEGQIKLIDFGIARVRGGAAAAGPVSEPRIRFRDTGRTAVSGTTGYMSPEQGYGGPVEARADLFSLGVLLHEMVTGERPFSGRSAWEVQFAVERAQPAPPSRLVRSREPRFDALLDRVVRRCLEKDARARHPDAVALLHDLQELWPLARSADRLSRAG